jgi:transposase InsO family protein
MTVVPGGASVLRSGIPRYPGRRQRPGPALDAWADDHGVHLYFIETGQPTQNAYIESFNGRYREECLNRHWSTSIREARKSIGGWRVDYNAERPHEPLEIPDPGGVRRRADLRQNAMDATACAT